MVIELATIVEGRKFYELIRRNKSSYRSGDELRRVDGRRHGPGVENWSAIQGEAFSPTVSGATGASDVEGKVARVSDRGSNSRTFAENKKSRMMKHIMRLSNGFDQLHQA